MEVGTYPVMGPIDMWAFGQMMLELTGSLQPPAHQHFTHSPAFKEEMNQCLPFDDPDSPLQRAHLQYLAALCAPACPAMSYADEVRSASASCSVECPLCACREIRLCCAVGTCIMTC